MYIALQFIIISLDENRRQEQQYRVALPIHTIITVYEHAQVNAIQLYDKKNLIKTVEKNSFFTKAHMLH